MKARNAVAILRVAWPSFVEVGGGVFLHEVDPAGLGCFGDLTAAEAFCNHVHVLDFVEHGAGLDGSDPGRGYYDAAHPDFLAAFEAGTLIAQSWQAKLARDFPGRRFRVYFCADDNPVVRFHTVRDNETPWLDERDWAQAVAAGRVIVLEVPSS
ncbi:hypothetical protein [Frigoriglobus tundricola]|uniref:Uncharacterized protein n=1 Tax=Frigoriglobus tundricola TaxID=2774151 RepID=A0A6M5Z4Q1_9BACT|nr:hypothetical protein [Frigoriglobus tundricola]QJX01209.1 hypothetical protein FTUN_8848 [Frigoriglobus tundricola]